MLGLRKTKTVTRQTEKISVSHEEFAVLAVGVAIERKAYAPVLLDLRNQEAFTEYFAILSASNSRQVAAVAEGIKTFYKDNFGIRPISVDGMESLNWVLLDYGFAFIHIFQNETRDIYRLEEMWSKARLVPVDEERFKAIVEKNNLQIGQ